MAQYFNLTLDTTAPSAGSAGSLQRYYNEAPTVTISASSATYMKVWVDQNATGNINDAPENWEVYGTSKTITPANQGTNYFHAVFMDEVGNISVIADSESFVYDTVAPTISEVLINDGDSITNNVNATVKVTFADATSGVDKITLSGDLDESSTTEFTLTDEDRTAGYKECAVVLTAGANADGTDGPRTVNAIVTDFAGNNSTQANDIITLDTTPSEATLVLRNADNTEDLPAYVNDDAYTAVLETEDTDITAYKIWEGETEPDSWTSAGEYTVETGIVISDQTLSSGDGLKTIHVKIKDAGDNVTALTDATVTLDTVAPTVTLSADPSVISAVEGFNSVVFTYTATDTNSAAGLNYSLKLGETEIKSGTVVTPNEITVTEAEIVAISEGESTKTFTLEVTDKATNTGTSNSVNVTVDLTAPTGSITAPEYVNSDNGAFTATIAATDTGGATLSSMRVWLDNETTDWIDFAAGEYTFNGTITEGKHVAKAQFKDSVGNVSEIYESSDIIVDRTAPTGSLSGDNYTNTTSYVVGISASDANGDLDVSGVAQMKIWEDGQTEPDWEAFAETKTVTLSDGDGEKSIKLKLKDNAGNESAILDTKVVHLDTDEPAPTIVLYNSDNSEALPARVNNTAFVARIASTDETAPAPMTYSITGDLTGTHTGTYNPDAGQTYMTISDLTLTDGDGVKTITVTITDEAGNSNTASATVYLDTAAPIITVSDVDYNIISKQHTTRLNASAEEISGTFNDKMTFKFQSNEKLQAYKICVNEANQTAEGSVAIGTAGGSINTSGGTVEAKTDVTVTIMGADFAATSAVNETDGAYEVIVYGQDEAGTWSEEHAITV